MSPDSDGDAGWENMTPEEKAVFYRECEQVERDGLIALGCFGCKHAVTPSFDDDPGPDPANPVGDDENGFPCGICQRNEKCPLHKCGDDNYEMEFGL